MTQTEVDLYEVSPYRRRHMHRIADRFRDRLVKAANERAERVKPSPIDDDIDGRHQATRDFAEHLAGVDVNDSRLIALQEAMRLTDGELGFEARAMLGAVKKGSDPDRVLTDMLAAAVDDVLTATKATRENAEKLLEHQRELMERIAAVEAENATVRSRCGELEALVQQRDRELDELRNRPVPLATRLAMAAGIEPGEDGDREPKPEKVKLPTSVFAHRKGFRAGPTINGRQKFGTTRATPEEAAADRDEMLRQANDENGPEEKAAA